MFVCAAQAVSVIASTAAGEAEILLDVDDDLSAFQRKVRDALKSTELEHVLPAELQLMGSARHLQNLVASTTHGGMVAMQERKVCLRSILPCEYFHDPNSSEKPCRRLRVTVVPLVTPQRMVVCYGDSEHGVGLAGLKLTSTVAELKVQIADALATPPSHGSHGNDRQSCRHDGPFQLQLRPSAFDLIGQGSREGAAGGSAEVAGVPLPDDSRLEMHTCLGGFSGARGHVAAVRIVDRAS